MVVFLIHLFKYYASFPICVDLARALPFTYTCIVTRRNARAGPREAHRRTAPCCQVRGWYLSGHNLDPHLRTDLLSAAVIFVQHQICCIQKSSDSLVTVDSIFIIL